MKWLCSVGVAVSLAMQPALAENLFGNHPLTPEARDAFVTDLLKKMTVDEKIGESENATTIADANAAYSELEATANKAQADFDSKLAVYNAAKDAYDAAAADVKKYEEYDYGNA